MFIVDKDKNIYTVLHDTAHFKMEIAPYEVKENDTLTFTVRKRYGSNIVLTTNADEDGMFHIESDMYDGVEPGNYLYDLQLTTGEGEIYTVVPAHPITIDIEITEEVADAE